MRKTAGISAMACVACIFACMVGCGDDSSNPSAESSHDQDPGSSSSQDSVGTTSSESVVASLVEFNTDPAKAGLSISPDVDGFYDMGDVYKVVPKTSKIAFVIRHSKREKKNTGKESQLTPIGVQMAQDLGKKLVGDESFYYASTDFVRTKETALNIAKGRGETADVVTWDGIDGGYFLTVPADTLDELVSLRGGNPKYIAQYAYGVPYTGAYVAERIVNYFYDFFPRGNQFVREVIVANISSWKRVSILVSHDMLVEPLVVFVSNRTIDLRIYEGEYRWINYLSGIAVISDESGSVTLLPVRGDEVGWMVIRDEVDEGV